MAIELNVSAVAAGTPSLSTYSTGRRWLAAKARPAAASLLVAFTATAPAKAVTDAAFCASLRTSRAPATALATSAGVAPVRRTTLARSATGVGSVVVVTGAPATVVGGASIVGGTVGVAAVDPW